MTDRKLIDIDNVTMGWDGRTTLDNVSLSVCRGDFMAITGPNGGGKTTLMRIILGLLKPLSGRVTYYGTDGRTVSYLPIGYLPQRSMIDLRFPITVREVIASGLLGLKGLKRDEADSRVDDMLTTVDLRSHSSKAIGELSGGQLQRTLLGRALVSRPEVVVLDEPLSYVDKHFEHRIYDIVGELKGHSTVLLVSHEMATIDAIANRHIIVDVNVRECHSATHYTHCSCDD